MFFHRSFPYFAGRVHGLVACVPRVTYDSKLAVVAKRADARRGDVVAVWVAALDLASQQETRGTVPDFAETAIAVSLDYEEDLVRCIFAGFRMIGMLTGNIVNAWRRRQYDGDYSTRRVRAYRERKQMETSGNDLKRDETAGNGSKRDETAGNLQNRTEQRTTTPEMKHPNGIGVDIDEWPKTEAALRKHLPTIDRASVATVITAAAAVVAGEGIDHLADASLAEAVATAVNFEPEIRFPLVKVKVPEVIRTWLKTEGSPLRPKRSPATVQYDPMALYKAEKGAKTGD
jgi:hypothetical protein